METRPVISVRPLTQFLAHLLLFVGSSFKSWTRNPMPHCLRGSPSVPEAKYNSASNYAFTITLDIILCSILPCFSYSAIVFTERRYLVHFWTSWTTAVAQLLPINCDDLFYEPSRVCCCVTASRNVRQNQTRTWSLPNSILPSAVRNERVSKSVFSLLLTYKNARWR